MEYSHLVLFSTAKFGSTGGVLKTVIRGLPACLHKVEFLGAGQSNSIYVLGGSGSRASGAHGGIGVAQDGQTAVLVLSDHGFTNFSRAVHLNRWLIENGFMVLKDEEEEGRPLLKSVDWSKTKAYAVGFCSLYINIKGREGQEAFPNLSHKLCRKCWEFPLLNNR